MRCGCLGLVLIVGLAGCKKDADSGPALQPVTGRLTRGGQPVGPLAQIKFENDRGQVITGITDADGKFELGTTVGPKGDRKIGVPEGSYPVVVMTPMDEKQAGGEIVRLLQKVQVKSGPNEIKLELPVKK